MVNLVKKIFGKKRRKVSGELHDLGFHGDTYLIKVADTLLKRSEYFIETGTNVGNTLLYVAKNYSFKKMLSCEPDKGAFDASVKNLTGNDNVTIFNTGSPEFLNNILENNPGLCDTLCCFWLDAHGYGFDWPLQYEINFITKHFKQAFILIDDFKVPGHDQFLYDEYKNQQCSFDYIKDSLCVDTYKLYYPKYKDKTSTYHPLKGWGLIVIGDIDINIMENLEDKIFQAH